MFDRLVQRLYRHVLRPPSRRLKPFAGWVHLEQKMAVYSCISSTIQCFGISTKSLVP
jgi:hypothetical protein